MAKVSMFGKFTCAPAKSQEMEAALAAQVAASNGADGVEAYSYHRGDDRTYWFFALFSTMEAMEALSRTEAMQAAVADRAMLRRLFGTD